MDNYNAVTKAAYATSNQEHLDLHREIFSLESDKWAGFKQWAEVGRKVRKGAKGCKIYMFCEKKQKGEKGEQLKNDKGEDAKKMVMKSLYVFNFDHTEEI